MKPAAADDQPSRLPVICRMPPRTSPRMMPAACAKRLASFLPDRRTQLIDSPDQHPRLAERGCDADPGVQYKKVSFEVLGERTCVSGEDDPGIRVLRHQVPRAMQEDHRLTGAGATAEPERSCVVACRIPCLLGVDEHPPCGEVAFFDDRPQLDSVVDESELHLRHVVYECVKDVLVLAGVFIENRGLEAEHIPYGVDRRSRRETDGRVLLPRVFQTLRQSENLVFGGGSEEPTRDGLREAQFVDEIEERVVESVKVSRCRDSLGVGAAAAPGG